MDAAGLFSDPAVDLARRSVRISVPKISLEDRLGSGKMAIIDELRRSPKSESH
jgi:hypothetical protein